MESQIAAAEGRRAVVAAGAVESKSPRTAGDGCLVEVGGRIEGFVGSELGRDCDAAPRQVVIWVLQRPARAVRLLALCCVFVIRDDGGCDDAEARARATVEASRWSY